MFSSKVEKKYLVKSNEALQLSTRTTKGTVTLAVLVLFKLLKLAVYCCLF